MADPLYTGYGMPDPRPPQAPVDPGPARTQPFLMQLTGNQPVMIPDSMLAPPAPSGNGFGMSAGRPIATDPVGAANAAAAAVWE
jgi:hypothetical protein